MRQALMRNESSSSSLEQLALQGRSPLKIAFHERESNRGPFRGFENKVKCCAATRSTDQISCILR